MKSAVYCHVCSSPRVYYAFSVQEFRLLGCRDCGHMMLNPPPSDEDLAEIYGPQYALTTDDPSAESQFARMKQATARYYLDLVREYRGSHGGELLEIGCGHGDLLAVADTLGYEVTGVEYSGHACEAARSRLRGRGRIVQGELSDLGARSAVYDVCVLSDVIEHVRSPRNFIESIRRVLKPDGVLFIATPTLDSWSAKLMKNSWMEFKPEHLHYFNQNSLHSLLFQVGYHKVVKLPGVKFLSAAYIIEHFRKYPVSKITPALHFLRVVPHQLKTRHLRLVASGMITICSAGEVPPRRKLSLSFRHTTRLPRWMW